MASRVMEELSMTNPSDWFMRMEAAHTLLEASSGHPIPVKTFAIATIGQEASTRLKDLLSPQEIGADAVTYAVLKDTLVIHLQAQHLEMAKCASFYTTAQRDGETASSFFSRLKKAAEFCNFGMGLDSMLRDRLVLGCRSLAAKKKLLTRDALTLKDAQDAINVYEAIELAHGLVLPEHPRQSGVDYMTRVKKPTKSSGNNAKPTGSCGNIRCRQGSRCQALGKKCSNCGKDNHFQKVYRSAKRKSIDAVVDTMHVNTLPVHAAAPLIQVSINGKAVSMEIDTGASATLISEQLWRSIGSPQL